MSSGDVDWETARLLGLKGNPPKGGATPAAGGCDCSPSLDAAALRDRLALIAEHGYSHSEGDDGRCVLCGDEWACDGWTQQVVQDHCEREIGPLADELRRVTAELQQAQQQLSDENAKRLAAESRIAAVEALCNRMDEGFADVSDFAICPDPRGRCSCRSNPSRAARSAFRSVRRRPRSAHITGRDAASAPIRSRSRCVFGYPKGAEMSSETGVGHVQPPSKREVAALVMTVKHMGRAMHSMSRAKLPEHPRFGAAPDWWLAWSDAEQALQQASNRLIDALEALDTQTTEGGPE